MGGMKGFMFAKFQNSPGGDHGAIDARDGRRRLDWHALKARLEAERELRTALKEANDPARLATSEGSFDPRAAQSLFARLLYDVQSMEIDARENDAGDRGRLRNSKSSDGSNPGQENAGNGEDSKDEGVSGFPGRGMSGQGVSRSE